MRIFLGIPVEDQMIEYYKSIILEQNKDLEEKIRWLKQGNYHLTLHFLGNVPVSKIQKLISILENLQLDARPFSIPLLKLGTLPEHKGRLIVIYAQLTSALAKLFSQLTEILTELDFTLEQRDYLPHITLARSKGDRKISMTSIELFQQITPAKEFIIYESVSEEGGSVYKPLFRYPLINV